MKAKDNNTEPRLLVGLGVLWGVLLLLIVTQGMLKLHSRRVRLHDLQRVRADNVKHLDHLIQVRNVHVQSDLLAEVAKWERQCQAVCFTPEALDLMAFRLETLAQTAGLRAFTVQHVEQGADRYLAGFRTLTQQQFKISFKGTFLNLLCFVNALERYEPALFVQAFNVIAELEEEQCPAIVLDVTALTARTEKEVAILGTREMP